MAFTPIPNCIQVRILWNTPIRPVMNVVHGFSQAAGPLNPNIADTFLGGLEAGGGLVQMLAQMPASTALLGVDVRDLRAANNPLISSAPSALVGTSVATPLPPQTAIVLTLRTAFAGPAFRGRIYVGGLATNADDTTGHIATAASTAVVTYGNAIANGFSTIAWTWCVAQRALPARPGHGGSTLPARDPSTATVTSRLVRDNIFDTQRRRTGAHIGSR